MKKFVIKEIPETAFKNRELNKHFSSGWDGKTGAKLEWGMMLCISWETARIRSF